MQTLAQLVLICACVIAIYVGIRTLLIWGRTRQVAELAIGWNVLGIALGAAILTGLQVRTSEPTAATTLLYALGLLSFVVHIGSLYAGTWKVFRPGARWPLGLVIAATGAAVLWMASSLIDAAPSAPRALALVCVRDVGMAWAAFESFRYSAMLRKRVALGLADPMIAHRIWLWGLGAGLQVVVISADGATWLAAGETMLNTPAGLYLASVLGLIGTGAVALAFFPPAAYVEAVEKRWSKAEAAETA